MEKPRTFKEGDRVRAYFKGVGMENPQPIQGIIKCNAEDTDPDLYTVLLDEPIKDGITHISEITIKGKRLTLCHRGGDKGKPKTQHPDLEDRMKGILEGLEEMVITKNRRYNNSALDQKRVKVFSGKCPAGERMDDKIHRIIASPELKLNDVADLMGYCLLTLAGQGYDKNDIINLID